MTSYVSSTGAAAAKGLSPCRLSLAPRVAAGVQAARHAVASAALSPARTTRNGPPSSSGAERWRCAAAEGTAGPAAVAEQQAAGPKDVPQSDVWELDFCSRPILDERGKKVWELIICDPQRTFEYAQYVPNNKINSGELKRALEVILALPGARKPTTARFFRGQMQTIISRALSELGITPMPSRRCFALMNWLEERIETVYTQHPGYNAKASTLFTVELGSPEDLPDALRGEKWSFVQLPLGTLQQELADVSAGKTFGATLDLSAVGQPLTPDTLVPGVAVYSRRADPLAAWTDSLDLAAVSADTDRAFLILETGFNARWKYGAYRRSMETTAEAKAWEEAKVAVGGLHFLAVMADEESELTSGLWLLLDRKPPNV
ncbi:hypothetical protein D9Q98_008673 [Chlorella vulgaris]|uniref:Uncharacterized protein n=1 Tax=Chlorella vulgaris TaxID=3077 RepID=A0A9D4YU41_CHLVU|nr:hypothetical protein D9Q98_008673 [Chlorella vulgaris]